ncbi:glycosyl hydrolase 108 family protein [Acinetobacter proteolyticus]|nr:glycosyl hydrolase 108 family protein [Acinetobacter proteolyticus]WEI18189.1 glycosyl hydrolase 108 family protein [Acinetobacter proteolyticus]
MAKTFQDALKRVLQHEGGYVNHPSDPGGETNYGITKATAQNYGYKGSMKNIPMDMVERIYKNQFWDALSCDSFPYSFAFQYFDAGVNHGLVNARKILQRALGVKDDGIVGVITLNEIRKQPQFALINLFNAERIQFYTRIKTFNTFGKGWMSRVSGNLQYAADDMR